MTQTNKKRKKELKIQRELWRCKPNKDLWTTFLQDQHSAIKGAKAIQG